MYVCIYHQMFTFSQSAGAIECTDYTFAER